MKDPKAVKEEIRRDYARIAEQGSSCCGPGSAGGMAQHAGYGAEQLGSVPREAANASLGCGNPLALARLKPGDKVLDLGSGAGLDLLLASQYVGPTGKVYGLDMTPEMIAKGRANLTKAGVSNAEILEGEIEAIPLPEGCIDLVISNCVINLTTDKKKAFREIYRVVKKGGGFSVSDIVTKDLPDEVRAQLPASGCVALALEEEDYLAAIRAAGFTEVEVTKRTPFPLTADGQLASACGCGCDHHGGDPSGQIISLTVQAKKA